MLGNMASCRFSPYQSLNYDPDCTFQEIVQRILFLVIGTRHQTYGQSRKKSCVSWILQNFYINFDNVVGHYFPILLLFLPKARIDFYLTCGPVFQAVDVFD
jgi:hypothetical protein